MKNVYLKYAVLICVIVIGAVYVIFYTNSASPAEAYVKDPIHDTVAGKLYGDVVQELTTIPAGEDEVVWVAVVGGNRIAGGSSECFESVVFYLMEKDGEKYSLGSENLLYDLEELSNSFKEGGLTLGSINLSGGKKFYFRIVPVSQVDTGDDRYTYINLKISTEHHALDAVLTYCVE